MAAWRLASQLLKAAGREEVGPPTPRLHSGLQAAPTVTCCPGGQAWACGSRALSSLGSEFQVGEVPLPLEAL